MLGIWLAAVNYACAREPVLAPTPQNGRTVDSTELAGQRIRPIREIGTAIAPSVGELPENVAQKRFAAVPVIAASEIGGRGWSESVYMWQAPALSYRPLYFEEPNVERYGHGAGCVVQPVLSGAHFFSAAVLLPVQLVLERPWELTFPLGHERPGSAAPWLRPKPRP
jgi:hypothetical protein